MAQLVILKVGQPGEGKTAFSGGDDRYWREARQPMIIDEARWKSFKVQGIATDENIKPEALIGTGWGHGSINLRQVAQGQATLADIQQLPEDMNVVGLIVQIDKGLDARLKAVVLSEIDLHGTHPPRYLVQAAQFSFEKRRISCLPQDA